LTLLDSSQLKVFLEIFHFLKFKFEILNWAGFKPAGTGTGPETTVTGVTGPDRFRSGKKTVVSTTPDRATGPQ